MAIVAKKETEERYSHLKKLYSDAEKEKVIPRSKVEAVEFKKEEIVLERKDYLRFLALFGVVVLIGVSGFLIQKFF